jgi:transposase
MDLPAPRKVYDFLRHWSRHGYVRQLYQRLRRLQRRRQGRAAEPSAGVMDAQSVDGSDTCPASTRGFDGAKLRDGRKRHVLTDSGGLLLEVTVTPANVHDSQAAPSLLDAFMAEPGRLLQLVWVDSAYQGQLLADAFAAHGVKAEVVKRADGTRQFTVLARRWVVEMCQAQCTHGCGCVPVSLSSVHMRRRYQPGGRVRRSRSSASSRWSAWAMRRCGQRLSRRTVIHPRWIQLWRVEVVMSSSAARSLSHHSSGPGSSPDVVRPVPVDAAGGAVQAVHEVTDGGRRYASAAFRGPEALGFEAVRDSGGFDALACEFADPIGQLRVVAELLQPLDRADDLSRGGGSAGPDDGDLHPLAGAPAR